MNTTPFRYSIGDIVKINKNTRNEFFQDRVGIIMGLSKTMNTNDYKVLISGIINSYYYFTESQLDEIIK